MIEWIKAVLDLQSIDMEVADLSKKVTAVPLVLRSLDDDLVTIANEKKEAIAKLQDYEKELKKIEIDAQAQEELFKKLEVQSNIVKSNEEFEAMKNEMARAQEKAEELEEKGVEMLITIEEFTEELEGVKKSCVEKVKAVEEKRVKLTQLGKDSAEKIDSLIAERAEAVKTIPNETLEIYEKIRKRKKDQTPALALLNSELKCGSCHLKNNPESRISITKGKVVFCDNCGAILYLAESLNG